jgi:uncharacterized protein YbaP (TraB family)
MIGFHIDPPEHAAKPDRMGPQAGKFKKSWRVLLAFLAVLLVGPAMALAQDQPASVEVNAHPSLWHIKGQQGEVYLLGAVHVLPANLHWRTPPIVSALSRSEVFVFEVPEDQAAITELQDMIQAHGYLPTGQSLRAQLQPQDQPDYDAALAASGLPAELVDRERPWLAGIQLMFAQMTKLKFDAANGVDSTLMAEAAKNQKQMRYLETIAEQFALLAPADEAVEMQEFQSGLKDLRDVEDGIKPMVDAWSIGDQAALDKLINGDLDEYPQARKLLLDDRNRRWVPKIEAMLKQKHVFFITVGAGHLTGPVGLPALLRADGYKVNGP